jgi:uracil-DNA glycosylase
VSKGLQENTSEVREILAEARAHLEWLRDAGVEEVEKPTPGPRPAPSTAPSTLSPAGGGAYGASARYRERPPASPSIGVGGSAPDTPDATQTQCGAYATTDNGCGSPALLAIREEIGDCKRCKLAGGRTTLVFGVGDPSAELMFVGEGPGADEDLQGEPFVGKAGQLLTKMIEAMGFRREEVYIANVVKCRPPGNRDPEPDEIAACEPFLEAQVAAVRPKVLVALGRFAVQTLLRDPTPISKQRGRWRSLPEDYGEAGRGVRLMPTFHPAYLLRNPPEKKKAWDDLQLVMKELGKPPPAR